ncbi:hypothetical protein [Edaphobacter sp.]|nr:hypothetical protein [Edaphobacter sp.]HEU5339840.1 hypothetical protein [Edaphobacter sp.]
MVQRVVVAALVIAASGAMMGQATAASATPRPAKTFEVARRFGSSLA